MRASGGAQTIASLIVLVVVWEICGRNGWVASGALPSVSQIIIQFSADIGDYGPHVRATLLASALGFAAGNLVALLAAVVFVLFPTSERVMRGFNIAVFALPPIALVPILIIAFQGMTPRIVLSAISVYYPVMTAFMLGLTQVDGRALDLVRVYSGRRLAELRFVRLRSAVPMLLAGLRVAAPNAVLGAILAEFGGGERWGLGSYLLGSLGQANPARLWGIGLTATAIAGMAYFLAALLAGRIAGSTRSVTIAPGSGGSETSRGGLLARLPVTVLAILVPILIWWLVLLALNINPIVAKTPLGLVDYLFFSRAAESAQMRFLAALGETIPICLLGMLAGLGVAFLLAVTGHALPAVGRVLLPISLVTQTMPLVALTPLLVLLLGRGVAVTLAITISVTFFPAFVTIAEGLRQVPRAAFELIGAYGANWLQRLRFVAVPFTVPYLFAAARLAVPRALLGVMIAEWLATGTGLGNLLNQSRGYLDYGMIWTVAVGSVLVSIALYQLTRLIEVRVTGRMGMRTGE